MDVAPEEPGNLDFIRDCHNEVCISIAQTCTDYDTAKAAFAAGASHMTHLYNAMPGFTHRAPGPIIAALEDGADEELITDNVHIHPAVVRFTLSLIHISCLFAVHSPHNALHQPNQADQNGRRGSQLTKAER